MLNVNGVSFCCDSRDIACQRVLVKPSIQRLPRFVFEELKSILKVRSSYAKQRLS